VGHQIQRAHPSGWLQTADEPPIFWGFYFSVEKLAIFSEIKPEVAEFGNFHRTGWPAGSTTGLASQTGLCSRIGQIKRLANQTKCSPSFAIGYQTFASLTFMDYKAKWSED
jgi:hypothetical protein